MEDKITELEKEVNRLKEELSLQNEEKEKHAAELIIANRELLFQNEEKEKRAAEIIIANRELLFQKKKRCEADMDKKENPEGVIITGISIHLPNHVNFFKHYRRLHL